MSNTSLPLSDSQTLLNQIVLDYLREKKRKKIWRAIKFFLIIAVLGLLFFKFKVQNVTEDTKAHIGLIDVNGTISDSEVNAENFAKSLDKAYKNKGLKALILRINSPGGSPVQADYMFNALQYYKKTYPEIKTYAVCVDVCASAAYYIAAGADYIYANESSMVGSIGVIYNGFGFVDLLNKVGVTRRLITAGKEKGFLDPFSPLNPEQTALIQGMLNEIHGQFIKKVKKGRGDRLKIDNLTFSGLFWTGLAAKERGLIDGFASSGQLAREIIKLESIIDYTYKQTVYEQMSKTLGASIANQLPHALGLYSGVRA